MQLNNPSNMRYRCEHRTVSNLRHITSPRQALAIATSCHYLNSSVPGHRDGGMNFLGVLGEHWNTCPNEHGATLVCTWTGQVSEPLPWEELNLNTPGVLFDSNGSGKHDDNDDPRYFLPFGSEGLIVNAVEFEEGDQGLLQGWCYLRGGLYAWLYERKWFHEQLLVRARKEVDTLNADCRAGHVQLTLLYDSNAPWI